MQSKLIHDKEAKTFVLVFEKGVDLARVHRQLEDLCRFA